MSLEALCLPQEAHAFEASPLQHDLGVHYRSCDELAPVPGPLPVCISLAMYLSVRIGHRYSSGRVLAMRSPLIRRC